jgi:replicative DNA helicase
MADPNVIPLPHSPEAEKSVVSAMLTRPKMIGEIVGTMLLPEHFYTPFLRRSFDLIVDSYFSDEPIDPLSIAQKGGRQLAGMVGGDTPDVSAKFLRTLAAHPAPHEAVAHSTIIRRDCDRRKLLELAQDIAEQARQEGIPPEQVASVASQRAMEICTNQILTNEIISYGDLGRRFVERQRQMMAAERAGIDVGAKFGWKFLDERLHGLKPGELWILGGEPGVGKSALAWCAAKAFAERQLLKPSKDDWIGTFVLSLEMGEEPSSGRLAASIGRVDSTKLRDGSNTDDELTRIINEWGAKKAAPLYFNFTSMLRASQLRALVVEAIRRYNVGVVVIDHMRYFNADERFSNAADEDEAKARFLKESIAKDLNVAVILLAHTTKAIENSDDRRPTLSHLRGGGMVAAHADFVSFMYMPYMHASEDDVLDGRVSRTEAELIWAKNRHSITATSHFHMDPSIMLAKD